MRRGVSALVEVDEVRSASRRGFRSARNRGAVRQHDRDGTGMALDRVSFVDRSGQVLGLVGESGAGNPRSVASSRAFCRRPPAGAHRGRAGDERGACQAHDAGSNGVQDRSHRSIRACRGRTIAEAARARIGGRANAAAYVANGSRRSASIRLRRPVSAPFFRRTAPAHPIARASMRRRDRLRRPVARSMFQSAQIINFVSQAALRSSASHAVHQPLCVCGTSRMRRIMYLGRMRDRRRRRVYANRFHPNRALLDSVRGSYSTRKRS